MELHGKNLIGGSASSEGTTTFRAFDPAQGSEIDPVFTGATVGEVDRAMDLAAGAFPTFRRLAPGDRALFLEAIAKEIEALGDGLIERTSAETGLGKDRLTGERGRTAGQLRMFAALVREGSWVDARIDTALPDRKPLPRPDVRGMLMPLGPVVVFGASNFPLAFSVAGGDTASAFAAGCPVVVKAHRSHPGCAEMVGRAIQRAVAACGLPEGVFSLIHGRGAEVGTALVEHPVTRAVGFTGSRRGGRELFDLAAARQEPIPVYAEMGSLNPVFVLPGALKARGPAIAEGLRGSVTLGVGQFCTNPGLVVGLDGREMTAFLAAAEGQFAGVPPGTMLNPGIRDAYETGVNVLSQAESVRLVAKSTKAVERNRTEAGAYLFQTDVRTFLDNPDLSDEVFGPATLVVTCSRREELLEVARGIEGHLTATLHGTEEDLAAHADLVEVLERRVGRLLFNGFPTGVEVCPAMHHGGPYPATTDGRSTSVGTGAIFRFTRWVCYQDFPQSALPDALKNGNPLRIWRKVNGDLTRNPLD
jgi:NADP-dependent aldehyde dehydrogenase